MKYNPDIHHRRSIRLRNYDYAQAGAYFVTICTQHRECLFSKITDNAMHLNDAGRMVGQWFAELEHKFNDIECDEFVCMPNHIHCIVVNVGQTHRYASTGTSLSKVVQWFKTMSTNQYIRGVKQNGWQPFPGKLWQRNYWEHIIRNQSELHHIREYIHNNPALWELDQLHPTQNQFPDQRNQTREPARHYGHEPWMV